MSDERKNNDIEYQRSLDRIAEFQTDIQLISKTLKADLESVNNFSLTRNTVEIKNKLIESFTKIIANGIDAELKVLAIQEKRKKEFKEENPDLFEETDINQYSASQFLKSQMTKRNNT